MFPAADLNTKRSFNAALDALNQGTRQQLRTGREGNVLAQETLLAGLPQFQNAILGQPTDLSGLQAQSVTFDPSFLNQQVPKFQNTGGIFPQQESTAAPPQQDLNALLTQLLGGQGNNFFSQFTDGGTDPTSLDQPDLSTRSDSELSLGLNIAKGLSNIPGLSIPSIFSQTAIQTEISRRGGISQGGTGPGSGFGGGEDEAGQVDQGLA